MHNTSLQTERMTRSNINLVVWYKFPRNIYAFCSYPAPHIYAYSFSSLFPQYQFSWSLFTEVCDY